MITPVAILDAQTFRVLFDSAYPLALSVRDDKKITRFTVEDGTQRSDHAVKLPVEITIELILTDDIRAQYEQMRDAFLNNREVVVQTKTANYPGMQIETFPNEQSFSAVNATMTLVEVQFTQPQYGRLPPGSVRNGADSSTLNRGQQQTANGGQGSTLFRILN